MPRHHQLLSLSDAKSLEILEADIVSHSLSLSIRSLFGRRSAPIRGFRRRTSLPDHPHQANNLEVDARFVYTKTSHMASLLSHCRPDCPIFAFTTRTSVRRRLTLQFLSEFFR